MESPRSHLTQEIAPQPTPTPRQKRWAARALPDTGSPIAEPLPSPTGPDAVTLNSVSWSDVPAANGNGTHAADASPAAPPSAPRTPSARVMRSPSSQRVSASKLRNRSTKRSASTQQVDIEAYKARLAAARKKITLFRSPFTTLYHFLMVLWGLVKRFMLYLLENPGILYTGILITFIFTVAVMIPGSHHEYLEAMWQHGEFMVWWLGLGVASSIGLGTGLHTFVLYLGPHIMSVTLAAAECRSLDFNTEGPSSEWKCPENVPATAVVTFFDIVRKVQWAAFLWGAGTAIGELPPYFVSRAARLAGERLADLEELEQESTPSAMDRIKVRLFHALQRYGFWAIVLAASIPNPLFDLAGITCGHFLVPFWTFFGATFIGKAIFKVTIQSMFVILMFNEANLSVVINWLESHVTLLHGKLRAFFDAQKSKFHKASGGGHIAEERPLLGMVWDYFLIAMLTYFFISIVNSSVQERLADLDQAKLHRLQRKNRTPAKSATEPDPTNSVRLLA